jgi:phage tail-like protein
MARSAATDPLRNFKFRVSIEPPAGGGLSTIINGISSLGFSVVSGLTVQNEMIAYREGGMNTHPHKMVGQSDYGPVTLTKGVFAGQDQLYKWQQFLHSWTQGADGTGNVSGSTREDNDYRCDVVVAVYDHPISAGSYQDPPDNAVDMGPAKIAYKLFNCWPASFSMGDLNAGDSSILIQQLVLNHEGFMLSFDSDAEQLVSSAN